MARSAIDMVLQSAGDMMSRDGLTLQVAEGVRGRVAQVRDGRLMVSEQLLNELSRLDDGDLIDQDFTRGRAAITEVCRAVLETQERPCAADRYGAEVIQDATTDLAARSQANVMIARQGWVGSVRARLGAAPEPPMTSSAATLQRFIGAYSENPEVEQQVLRGLFRAESQPRYLADLALHQPFRTELRQPELNDIRSEMAEKITQNFDRFYENENAPVGRRTRQLCKQVSVLNNQRRMLIHGDPKTDDLDGQWPVNAALREAFVRHADQVSIKANHPGALSARKFLRSSEKQLKRDLKRIGRAQRRFIMDEAKQSRRSARRSYWHFKRMSWKAGRAARAGRNLPESAYDAERFKAAAQQFRGSAMGRWAAWKSAREARKTIRSMGKPLLDHNWVGIGSSPGSRQQTLGQIARQAYGMAESVDKGVDLSPRHIGAAEWATSLDGGFGPGRDHEPSIDPGPASEPIPETEPEQDGTEPEQDGKEPEQDGKEPEQDGTEPGTEPEQDGTEHQPGTEPDAPAPDGPESDAGEQGGEHTEEPGKEPAEGTEQPVPDAPSTDTGSSLDDPGTEDEVDIEVTVPEDAASGPASTQRDGSGIEQSLPVHDQAEQPPSDPGTVYRDGKPADAERPRWPGSEWNPADGVNPAAGLNPGASNTTVGPAEGDEPTADEPKLRGRHLAGKHRAGRHRAGTGQGE